MNRINILKIGDLATLPSVMMYCDICGFEERPCVIFGTYEWLVIKGDNMGKNTDGVVCHECVDLIQGHKKF